MPAKDWGILERNKPHPMFIEWQKHMVPFHILDILIAAGLGDIPQRNITRPQFEKAMERARKWTTY